MIGDWFRWRRKAAHCPHCNLQGIYGDAIRAYGDFRLVCLDCGTFLDGPVKLAGERHGTCTCPTHNEVAKL